MEHYITEIYIEKLRHLQDIRISLNQDTRQHLLITGKNGSGKTSLLLAIEKYLSAVNEGDFYRFKHDYVEWLASSKKRLAKAKDEREKYALLKECERDVARIGRYRNGIDISFQGEDELDMVYADGNFITASYHASRKVHVVKGKGVENIKLQQAYAMNESPGPMLHKYMVHLKTQQAYALNAEDTETEQSIQAWFDRFEGALKILLDDDSIRFRYDYKTYDFVILQEGREPFGLDTLSDGYSSVLNIVSDLIMRMDQNWLLGEGLSDYDKEGIVLIDELETHLHIELQKKILPFLTEFFPRIQFVVTTHSPYILGSVDNAKAYDLEHCIELEHADRYTAVDLAETYFDVDAYSERFKQRMRRYLELRERIDLSEEERAERAELRLRLKETKQDLAQEILGDEAWMGGDLL